MTNRRRAASLAVVESVDAAEEADVLIDRQQLVEREPLRHVADPPLDAFGIARDVDAADDAPSRGRRQQAAQHADGRGLAGAVAAEEAEDLAAPHVEADAIDGDELAEAARQIAHLDRAAVDASGQGPAPAAPRRAGRAATARVRSSSAWRRATCASSTSVLVDDAGPEALADDALGLGGRADPVVGGQ